MKETKMCNEKCSLYLTWCKDIYKNEEKSGMLREDGTCMAKPRNGEVRGRTWRDREDTRIANKRTHADRMNSYNHGYGYEDS